jgi:hypothetical protein
LYQIGAGAAKLEKKHEIQWLVLHPYIYSPIGAIGIVKKNIHHGSGPGI